MGQIWPAELGTPAGDWKYFVVCTIKASEKNPNEIKKKYYQ